MTRPKLILGSQSPRRAELLSQIGVSYDEIRPADVDEAARKGELPLAYCRRVALAKAMATVLEHGEVLLCADTTVVLGRRILGKPADEAEALAYLTALSGRRHRVITSVVVRRDEKIWSRDVTTVIKMKRLSDQEAQAYIACGEWQGKAGGYAIQGQAGAFISWIQGSYSAVVGLPMAETHTLLTSAGYPVTEGWS